MLVHEILIWIFFTTVFGLLPIWLIILHLKMQNKTIDYFQFISDGSILFFASALVTSLTIDYHFSDTTIEPKLLNGFLFSFFPLIIIILCVLIYITCYDKSENQLNRKLVTSSEAGILIATYVYVVTIKVFGG